MKLLLTVLLAILLASFSAAAWAQTAPDDAQAGYAGPYGDKHVEQKRDERIAIGLRVERNLRLENDRNEVRYAESRRRCQRALQVAALCGKFAGTFTCDAKGFTPIKPDPAVAPVVLDNNARYKLERCTRDAALSE